VIYETLLIGIVVAVVYTEVLEVYPGGIIVPAYVALHLDHPLRVLTTLSIAFLSLFAYRLLARHLILFGKRRFVTLVLMGVLLSQILHLLSAGTTTGAIDFMVVSWLVPGLLANNLEKQQWLPTLASLATVAVLTYVLAHLFFLP
jgi:poly-gamma-glutamate biosynthesis protein PgsC/CapC